MYTKSEPNVAILKLFLKLLNIKVNSITINDVLLTHPNFPSVLAISDSLNKWKVPNGVGKIKPDKFDLLSPPFIAHIQHEGEFLCIVKEVTSNEVQYSLDDNDKIITESRNDFFEKWTGVYLIAEKTDESGEQNYKRVKLQSVIKIVVVMCFVILLNILLLNNINVNISIVGFGNFIQYVIMLIGGGISCLLLKFEIDNSDPLLNRFCSSIEKGNCDAVLSSKQSRIFNWLSWSEIGFFYFIGGIITMSFMKPIENAMTIISVLNILALPYTVFSIYYQAQVIKQWCLLCLIIQVLIVLGGVNIFYNQYFNLLHISISEYFQAIIFYSIPVLFWYILKPYLFILQKYNDIQQKYIRLKLNFDIFDNLLKSQKRIKSSPDQIGVEIGNPNAANELIKVCNPYCNPCSMAHPQIDKLLDEIPNLKVKIIFNTPTNSSAFEPTAHILSLTLNSTDDMWKRKVLNEWYSQNIKDYDFFSSRFPLIETLQNQKAHVESMDQWCKKNNIMYTPTFFINGYQLPDVYDLDNISYFLAE